METNKLIVNRILQVHEPSAKRLGLDRLEEDRLILAFGRWAEGQIRKWIDTAAQFVDGPLIRSALAIKAGDGRKAVDALAVTSPYDFADMAPVVSFAYPPYLRGLAYLLLKDGASATREFQKILDQPRTAQNWLGPVAHLGVGRAMVLTGDLAKAKTAYQDFFALWKDADADVPILKQAKAEYARLN